MAPPSPAPRRRGSSRWRAGPTRAPSRRSWSPRSARPFEHAPPSAAGRSPARRIWFLREASAWDSDDEIGDGSGGPRPPTSCVREGGLRRWRACQESCVLTAPRCGAGLGSWGACPPSALVPGPETTTLARSGRYLRAGRSDPALRGLLGARADRDEIMLRGVEFRVQRDP